MEDARTNWLVFLLGCVLAAGVGLTGCGGTKITKTDASGSTTPDGASPSSDAIFPDTPMATGGSGGTFGYDGPANVGGLVVGVGTAVTRGPLHGSGRAGLPHPALALGDDAEAH
jgi:hypothetical protein